jgi:2-succinyl-5-enolpyruvyl-6-hydroxy-3-cyclohexene-1-carboxylate synthase
LANGQKNVLITGDVGFFYDQNAFWQEKLPQNLTVILLNNSGGNIFRLIEGPSKQPELNKLFETWQGFTAKPVAEQIGCLYLAANSKTDLANAFCQALERNQLTILEVFTDKEENAKVFTALKSEFR